jgi:hypothetical protein
VLDDIGVYSDRAKAAREAQTVIDKEEVGLRACHRIAQNTALVAVATCCRCLLVSCTCTDTSSRCRYRC